MPGELDPITCNECGDSVDSVCDNCSECTGCCDCISCDHSGCDNVYDPDGDDNFCSNCRMCGSHCSCSSCSYCGEPFDSTCGNCDRCDNHCECVTCGSCEEHCGSVCDNCERCTGCCSCVTCESCNEHVSSLECTDCDRCSECGCTCGNDEEEEDGEAAPVAPEDQPAVTYTYPPRIRGSLCPHCGNAGCSCRICWEFPVEGFPKVGHIYQDSWGEVTCQQCHTCHEHCRAAFTCTGCGGKRHELCPVCSRGGCCCGCYHCNKDSKPFTIENFCTRCNRCIEHCSCPKCRVCGVKGAVCDYCNQCHPCCQNPSSTCGASGRTNRLPIPHVDRPNLVWNRPANRLGFKRNPSHRELGVEIELNNFLHLSNSRKLWDAIQKWNVAVKPDGSIGSQPQAFEMNLMPSSGDTFLEELEELCEGMEAIRAEPDQKCGIHVHVNASDIRADDLKRVIDIYALTERALFGLCHPRRLSNRYCTVCGKHYQGLGKTGQELRRNIVKSMYNNGYAMKVASELHGGSKHSAQVRMGDNLKCNKAGNGCDTRYRALNMASYFKRGTIEFRHYDSMTDFKDISGWAMTVGHLIDAAVRMTHRQILVLPNNSRKALMAVLPEWHHPWLIDRWTRMDAIVNANSTYRNQRMNVWGV